MEYPTVTGTAGKRRTPTHATYKRTRREALEHENTTPYYEMFDLDTGVLKEKYRRNKSPSPPPGTVVFEVGTGRAFVYSVDARPKGVHPEFGTLEALRRAASSVASGVLPLHTEDKTRAKDTTCTTNTEDDRGTSLRHVALRLQEDTAYHVSSELPPSTDSAQKSVRLDQPASMLTEISEAKSIPTTPMTEVSGFRDITNPPPTAAAVSHKEQQKPAESSSHRSVMCNCIALVSTDNVAASAKKPEFTIIDDYNTEIGEAGDLTARSPTLRYLRIGYRNYVVNNVSDEVHRLTGYICRIPKRKTYMAFKSIVCTGNHPQKYMSDHVNRPTTTSTESNSKPSTMQSSYRLLTVINQYLNVFATLGDFNYTWPVPPLKGGVCNALVVNKLWVYSPVRKIYLPVYRLLSGDEYTSLAVAEMRELVNRGVRMRYVRFLSSSFTALYTNRPTLVEQKRTACSDTKRSNSPEPAPATEEKRSDEIGAIKRFRPTLPIQPQLFPPHQSQPSTSSSSVAQLQKEPESETNTRRVPEEHRQQRRVIGYDPIEYRLHSNGWPQHEHKNLNDGKELDESKGKMTFLDEQMPYMEEGRSSRQSLDRPLIENTETVKNPTLIVYKQNVDFEDPETLVCYIIAEMCLGNQIQY